MPARHWLARLNLVVTNRLLGPLARHLPGMGSCCTSDGKLVDSTTRQCSFLGEASGWSSPYLWTRVTVGPQCVGQDGCELETESRRLQLSHPHLLHDEHGGRVSANTFRGDHQRSSGAGDTLKC
jgi:hypothetical protein